MTDTTPIEHAGNTVLIRAKRMGWGVRNRVAQEARAGGMSDAAAATALLVHNIVSWSGPDLDGKPVTAETLDDLDPDLGDAVLTAITEVNKVVDPKEPTSDTASSSPAKASRVPSATTTLTS